MTHVKRIWVGLGVVLGAFLVVSSVFSLQEVPSQDGDFFFLLGNAQTHIDPFVGQVYGDSDTAPITLLERNSLVAMVPPLMVSPQTLGYISSENPDTHTHDGWITEYVVKEGDSVSSIATQFDLSLNTILWANELSQKSIIQPGQKLVILPVDGVIHHVQEGDIVGTIAQRYKASIEDIVEFNKLSSQDDIFIGDILIIPGGTPPPKASPSAPQRATVARSYFIRPIQGGRVSQRLHWYNAIDFAAPCGTPIFASAGGNVQRVQYGWNGGGGNLVTILHPNGVVTYYGHIQQSIVAPGQYVNQGQMIATIGGQPGTPGAGISTGCHVHFGVHGASNPFQGLGLGQ